MHPHDLFHLINNFTVEAHLAQRRDLFKECQQVRPRLTELEKIQ